MRLPFVLLTLLICGCATTPKPVPKIVAAAKPKVAVKPSKLAAEPSVPEFEPRTKMPPIPDETAIGYAKPFKIAWKGQAHIFSDYPFMDGETVYQIAQNDSKFPFGYKKRTIKFSRVGLGESSSDSLEVDVEFDGEKPGYDYSTFIGGYGLRSLLHATGDPCKMPKVEIPPETDAVEFQKNPPKDLKLPVIKCEYKLDGQTTVVTLKAVAIVAVAEVFNLSYLSEVSIKQGTHTYQYSPSLPFEVAWAGDLNDDGFVDFVTSEDTSHVSGASPTLHIMLSKPPTDKEPESKLLYESVANFAKPGC